MDMSSIREGKFTSSEIAALTTKSKDKKEFGKPALTYIKKKNYERRLGRSLLSAGSSKPMQWGNLVESNVFGILPLSYTLNSQETLVHSQYADFWCGTPDGFKLDEGKTVVDIKCPYTHLSFCDLVEPLYRGLTGLDAMTYIRDNHDEGDTYFWQIVSNAILSGANWGELIVYMPYRSEIPEIQLKSEGNPEAGWVQWAADLPFILDGGFYKNINIIRFPITQEDKDELTECVLKASKLLIEYPQAKNIG